MKAKDIVKHFSQLDPEEDIAILWFERPKDLIFDEAVVNEKDWENICKEFANDDYVGQEALEFIDSKIAELGEQ